MTSNQRVIGEKCRTWDLMLVLCWSNSPRNWLLWSKYYIWWVAEQPRPTNHLIWSQKDPNRWSQDWAVEGDGFLPNSPEQQTTQFGSKGTLIDGLKIRLYDAEGSLTKNLISTRILLSCHVDTSTAQPLAARRKRLVAEGWYQRARKKNVVFPGQFFGHP